MLLTDEYADKIYDTDYLLQPNENPRLYFQMKPCRKYDLLPKAQQQPYFRGSNFPWLLTEQIHLQGIIERAQNTYKYFAAPK